MLAAAPVKLTRLVSADLPLLLLFGAANQFFDVTQFLRHGCAENFRASFRYQDRIFDAEVHALVDELDDGLNGHHCQPESGR